MNFLELVKDAKLELLFMSGTGLGAVLLAIVVIVIAYLLSPKISGFDAVSMVRAWRNTSNSPATPPPKVDE